MLDELLGFRKAKMLLQAKVGKLGVFFFSSLTSFVVIGINTDASVRPGLEELAVLGQVAQKLIQQGWYKHPTPLSSYVVIYEVHNE